MFPFPGSSSLEKRVRGGGDGAANEDGSGDDDDDDFEPIHFSRPSAAPFQQPPSSSSLTATPALVRQPPLAPTASNSPQRAPQGTASVHSPSWPASVKPTSTSTPTGLATGHSLSSPPSVPKLLRTAALTTPNADFVVSDHSAEHTPAKSPFHSSETATHTDALRSAAVTPLHTAPSAASSPEMPHAQPPPLAAGPGPVPFTSGIRGLAHLTTPTAASKKKGLGAVSIMREAPPPSASLTPRGTPQDAERQRAAQEEAERQRAAQEEAERQRAAQEEAERQRAAQEEAERQRAAQEEAERQRAAQEEAERQRAVQEAQEGSERREFVEQPAGACPMDVACAGRVLEEALRLARATAPDDAPVARDESGEVRLKGGHPPCQAAATYAQKEAAARKWRRTSSASGPVGAMADMYTKILSTVCHRLPARVKAPAREAAACASAEADERAWRLLLSQQTAVREAWTALGRSALSAGHVSSQAPSGNAVDAFAASAQTQFEFLADADTLSLSPSRSEWWSVLGAPQAGTLEPLADWLVRFARDVDGRLQATLTASLNDSGSGGGTRLEDRDALTTVLRSVHAVVSHADACVAQKLVHGTTGIEGAAAFAAMEWVRWTDTTTAFVWWVLKTISLSHFVLDVLEEHQYT